MEKWQHMISCNTPHIHAQQTQHQPLILIMLLIIT